MADENDAKRSIRALQYGLASLKMVVRRQQVVILLGLMVTSLLAPVVSLTEGSDMSDETEIRRPLLGAVVLYFEAEVADFGSLSSRPYALPGGLWLTRIGLVLLIVGLLAVAITCWGLLSADISRATRIKIICAGTVLVLGVLLVWLGQAWLPDDEQGTTTDAAWGLLVAIGCAVWLWHAVQASTD